MKVKRIWLSAFLFCVSLSGFAQTPTQNLSLSGLKEKVTVRRDARGIPYIEAANEADLYFAQGYATAQDRLWQLDLLRRVARGETAEIFGKTTLEEDKRWRKFGFAQIAQESLKYTAPEIRFALESYARGVNAYLNSLDDKSLPVEFQILKFRPAQWQPTDSILIGAILGDALSTTWHQDLLKASLQDLPKEKLEMMFNPSSQDDVLLFGKDSSNPKEKGKSQKAQVDTNSSILDFLAKAETIRRNSLERVGLYAENLAASNNWVVSGKRTIDGKAMLANDPHLRPAQPPIWYLVHLTAPNLRVSGVTFPGAPGVVLGHNEFIAWGATNVGPDVQDLYLETFEAGNALKYKTPTGWENAKVRTETIKFRKTPISPETETENLDVIQTRNGVIFAEDGGKKYALKWTAFDPKLSTFDAFYYINRARNWEEYKNALKVHGGAMQNFIYADVKGNIGWYAAGKVPIRKTGDGSLPYDGATDNGAWTGFIPFEELPNLYNPKEGFIVTANQRTVGTAYKYHDLIARVYEPFRARRIFDLINANTKLSVNDSRDIQMDTFSILNSRFAREIIKENAASETTLNLLRGWDGRMNPDSRAALLADEIRVAFRKRILAANLGGNERAARIRWANEGNFFDRILTEKPKDWLPKEFSSYAELFKAAETDARAALTKRLGADEVKWTWGESNKTRFPHALVSAPFIGGHFAVPSFPSKGSGNAAASPNVASAVSMRFIATPPDWDATRQVITTGQSGDPKSPHWADELDSWYSGNSPVFPFSKEAVEKAAKQIIVLTPK